MISIVVPVLNEEGLLADCLKSLAAQDYAGEYEVVVVDNGSTDRSVSIAEALGARVIVCPIERDVAAARSYGARESRGEIVAQADADTVYPRDWLTRITAHFADPDVVAVAGAFVYRTPARWGGTEVFLRHVMNRGSTWAIGRPALVSGANFAFRKAVYQHTTGYDTGLYAPDQWGLANQLSKLGKVKYDGSLAVATSSRRRDKPTPLLFKLFCQNLYRGFSRALRERLARGEPTAEGRKAWKAALQAAAIILVPLFVVTSLVAITVFLFFWRHANRGLRQVFRGRQARGQPAPEAKKARKATLPLALAILLPLFVAIGLIAHGYFVPGSTVFGQVHSKAKTGDKVVALTFDDGPNEPYTSEILDILDSYGITATFFVTGKNAELYPETVRRMVVEGHIVANHSYHHNANHALTNEGIKDMDLAADAIHRVAGVEPRLYRPPHGRKSPWELYHAAHEGMVVVTWNVSGDELHAKDAASFAESIVRKTKPGSIIGLHDGYGNDHGTPQADKSLLVESLPLIIEALQNEGYYFVTVPELLGQPAYSSVAPEKWETASPTH